MIIAGIVFKLKQAAFIRWFSASLIKKRVFGVLHHPIKVLASPSRAVSSFKRIRICSGMNKFNKGYDLFKLKKKRKSEMRMAYQGIQFTLL